jgi:triacylglycerol lipase
MNESHTAPIVLVHGIFGFNQLTFGGTKVADYFRLVPAALRSDGHIVPAPPQLNRAGSVAERAEDLKNYLEDPNRAEVFQQRVHIVAHSMGGLDARFMISQLDMADRVLSLTTIATPHDGSPIADLVVAGASPLLNKLMKELGVNVKASFDLTTAACRQRNIEVLDHPGVAYFSISGQFEPPRIFGKPHGLLGIAHDIIARTEGHNDGLVSYRVSDDARTIGVDRA